MPGRPTDHIRTDRAIAVVGMSAAFASARDIAEFWNGLLDGEALTTRSTPAQLDAAGIQESVQSNEHFVPVTGITPEPDLFDAQFFGFSGSEAETTDPQQRKLLEHCWKAMEVAGYTHGETGGPVGVFVSVSRNDYRLRSQHDPLDSIQIMGAAIGNDPDMAATRISYKLGLTGPSATIQTACSSSLVAIHTACRNILAGECTMALCGGASLRRFEGAGYLYRDGGIFSSDGSCRPFDSEAQGTVPGDGVGVVLLKRLEDALTDGDHVHAVVLGSAVNNDGSNKIGFTAPSTEGQKAVIEAALASAGLQPADIGYVEAHGTATKLGDPIEFQALAEIFTHESRAACSIGSVKGNVGHLDATAGVCGFIKAVLSIEQGEIPPTRHYTAPNPHLGIEDTPISVVARRTAWPDTDRPRVAGVSSFGIGGTNAHVLLGQAPARPADPESDVAPQVIAISTQSDEALVRLNANLAGTLSERHAEPLSDIAETLRARRLDFPHRAAVVASDTSAAAEALLEERKHISGRTDPTASPPKVCFVLPGQGALRQGAGSGLYASDAVFRATMDACEDILRDHADWSLTDVVFGAEAEGAGRLQRTQYAQPVIFSLSVALAASLRARGLTPDLMIGHSLGELTAAHLAGVMSLEDAVQLVIRRGEFFEACPEGQMLAVALSAEEVAPYLIDGVSLAAVNSDTLCTLAGQPDAIATLAAALKERKVVTRVLGTNRAFHTALVDPALPPYEAELAQVAMSAPKLSLMSNLTGDFVTEDQAVSPSYWRDQARSVVQFHDGVERIKTFDAVTFVEIGPASGLIAPHPGSRQSHVALLPRSSLSATEEHDKYLTAIAQLWVTGHDIDMTTDPGHRPRRRIVPLPTYPFDRTSFLLPPVEVRAARVADDQRETESQVTAHQTTKDTGTSDTSAALSFWPDDPLARQVAARWSDV
ncbi:MAG: type I polyketide synthase, partial [Pseudomonadota bacterium]